MYKYKLQKQIQCKKKGSLLLKIINVHTVVQVPAQILEYYIKINFVILE